MVPSRESPGMCLEWKWCLSQAVRGPEWGRDRPSTVLLWVWSDEKGQEGPGWGESKSLYHHREVGVEGVHLAWLRRALSETTEEG